VAVVPPLAGAAVGVDAGVVGVICVIGVDVAGVPVDPAASEVAVGADVL
jgi:hypothetical protein